MPTVKLETKKDTDKLIDSMYDTPFKAIIQHPDFRKILSMIISQVTLYSESYIYEHLKFLNTELPAENSKEKKKITDILAKVEGNIINIEANKSAEASKITKNSIYHHKLMYGKYFKGNEIDNMDVFQINFNTVNRFDDRIFIEFKMRDDTGTFTDEENFKRIHINMSQPLDKYDKMGIESLTKLEKILVMFQITSRKKLREIAKGDSDLENMAKIIEDLNEDEEIIGQYDSEKLNKRQHELDLMYAERKGLNQGLEQGLEQGSNETRKEIAKSMLEAKMEVSEIIKFTGLSENEINEIKSEES